MGDINLKAALGGQVTLTPTDTASNYTATFPAVTGTVLINNSSSQTLFPDGTAAAPSISNDGDANTGIFFPAADTIAFSEGGVESMRIDASGNVGIGTSSPAYKLDVNGSVSGTVVNASNGMYINPNTIATSYTIPTNYNAMSAGKVTINSGVTVNIPSGSRWVIV